MNRNEMPASPESNQAPPFRGVLSARANAANAANAQVLEMARELRDAFLERFHKVEARMDELQGQNADLAARATALSLSGGGSSGGRQAGFDPEARRELAGFVREGNAEQKLIVRASMSVDSDPDGGYAVSPATGNTIQRKIFDTSPLARLARRVVVSVGDAYEELWDASDIGASWVGEREARPETTAPNLRVLSVPLHEIYANIPVTQKLLDDSQFDIAGWISDRIAEKFARSIAAAVVNGDGIKKPRGLLSYPTDTAADATRPWGTIQHINTGASGAFGSPPAGGDAILSLAYSLRAPYRPNARFMMNLATTGVVRKLKDAEGRYLWADPREGQPATLAGFPAPTGRS